MRTKGVIIFGVSILLSALIFGIFFYKSRIAQNTIRVTGYATKRFDSDVVKWTITVNRPVGLNDMKTGYQLIRQDVETLTNELKKNSINDSDITIQPVSSQQQYNRDGLVSGYNVRQTLYVISNNLNTIEKLARNPDFIYNKGIILESSYMEYNYTKISVLKKELLAEATKDAKSRALEIANSSGSKLGKMISARQGVFQITEPNSTEVSDYGVYSTATKTKDITVTLTVSFIIK